MYKIFVPKSTVLQKYIYNFCILQEFDEPINYLAFPQMGMTMAFYMNSEIIIEDNCINLKASEKHNHQLLLLGKYKLPIQLRYQNFIPEISINFTPTGLNYFFKLHTSSVAQKMAQFIDSKVWKQTANEIYNEQNDAQKIEKLESFLLSILIEKNLSIVESCISLLNENLEHSISDLADKLEVSTKTVNRNFTSYVGCTPMDFKKIIKFRKATNLKFNDPLKNLTQICFDSNFYDSPHFTREFKKLTRMSPSAFFSEIESVANKDIPYKFL